MEAATEIPDNNFDSKRLEDLMSEYMTIKKNAFSELHPMVRKRINALKNLQLETLNYDAEFHRAVYDLERKFQVKHDEIFKKRQDIVNGKYEPKEEECNLPDNLKIEEIASGGDGLTEKPHGIPDFWLTVIKNVNVISSMIKEIDEPVLKHLVDIKAIPIASPDLSFVLEFHFEPNDYFSNSVLTKTYYMKCVPEQDDPFSFEGPEIYKSTGCEISWKPGKNVTEKSIKKKDTTMKTLKTASFFDFFNPPDIKLVESEDSEKIEEYLEKDFEIGHFIKERVIPRAVLYFTGEIEDEFFTDDDTDSIESNSQPGDDDEENQENLGEGDN